MLASDVAVLDELIADDLVFATYDGRVATKAEDLAAHRDGVLRLAVLDPSDRHVRTAEGAIVVSVRVHAVGTYMGQHVDSTFRYIRIWMVRDGSWKIVAGQMTQVSEPG